ncbi:cupin domain-containing protein [Endozoicomonas sp.]|uniref:cupin domain-containing protein n=1 Tax=Endozoicomonas sp. TaxID=1892382 RepID=UPI00383BCD3D
MKQMVSLQLGMSRCRLMMHLFLFISCSSTRKLEESLFILKGTVLAYVDGETFVIEEGGSIHVPRNVPKVFKPAGNETVEMIVHVQPAGLEQLFIEFGVPALDRKEEPPVPSVEEMGKTVKAAERYGMIVCGPDPFQK